MAAPTVYQAAWHWLTGPTANITVDGAATIPLAPVTAGRSLIVMGSSMNVASANIEPVSVGDNAGNGIGAGLSDYVERHAYIETSNYRVLYRLWHMQQATAGITGVSMTFSNNYYPTLIVFETDECELADPIATGNDPSTTDHNHANTGITVADVFTACMIGGLGNSDYVVPDPGGDPMPGYTRFHDPAQNYRRRFAAHYRQTGSHSNDRVPITSTIPQISVSYVATFSAVSAGPQPPVEDTPTPDLPAAGSYLQGDAINVDVSGNWSVGSGGTGPLTFTAGAGMVTANLAMSSAGVITGTAAFDEAATGLTYTVDDAANNGPTTSSTFDYNVTDPSPVEDTPTPSPINATEGVAGSQDVSGNWSAGPGGTEPLTFTAGTSPAWPAGLTITTAGLIQWTDSVTPNTYSGLKFDVDDAAFNGPTESAPFDFIVASAIGTLRSQPAVEVDTNGDVIDVRGLTGCTVEVWTLAGVRVYREENVDQAADGRFTVQNAAIASGTDYKMSVIDPAAPNRAGIATITATSG